MTCHHKPGDPDCSHGGLTYEADILRRENKKLKESLNSPDSNNFEIVDAKEVGSALVLKVKYPSCAKCAYEGTKVLVYFNAKAIDALKWNKIDPHFRDAKPAKNEAPSPDARFPASEKGWNEAIGYLHFILNAKKV